MVVGSFHHQVCRLKSRIKQLQAGSTRFILFASLSMALHVALLVAWGNAGRFVPKPDVTMSLLDPVPPRLLARKAAPRKVSSRSGSVEAIKSGSADAFTPRGESDKTAEGMPPPPAPTAEQWQQASTYTLKNSKRYRHTWGQQVRSQMGTAVAGPDQGRVSVG
jgi:hypothetical protein